MRPIGMQQQQGGQTTYNLTPNPAQPGVLSQADRSQCYIVSVVAGVAIPFGVLCETYTSSGKILARPVQDTGTTTSFTPTLAGISVLDAFAVEQTYVTFPVPPSGTGSSSSGWPIGVAVPFLRRGRIWASWDGNTGVALPTNGAIQVWHSSTGANPQGVFTTKAAQTTAGAEIDAAGAYINLFDPNQVSGAYTDSFGNVLDMVNLEINLPGHS
jgi:hypothetical protein